MCQCAMHAGIVVSRMIIFPLTFLHLFYYSLEITQSIEKEEPFTEVKISNPQKQKNKIFLDKN